MTKSELMLRVGRNIRRIRLERHMTQDELAERACISTSYCANIERGMKSVSLLVLFDIADALQVSANDLLYEESKENRIAGLDRFLSSQPEAYVMKIEQVARLFAGSNIDFTSIDMENHKEVS